MMTTVLSRKRSWVLALSLSNGLVACVFALNCLSARAQEWIWLGNKPGENDIRYFRKSFLLDAPPSKAVLTVACDNKATVFLDGKVVGENTEWNAPTAIELTASLKAGTHLLAIRAENEGSAAGLLVRLEATVPGTKKLVVVSDASWSVSEKGEAGWNKPGDIPGFVTATSLGKHGMPPWGNVLGAVNAASTERNSRPGSAAPAESLKVADGFKVELLRSAEPGEGSWVALTFDNKGRLLMSPQDKEPMLRITLSKSGQIASMEKIDLPVTGAMGMLYAFDSLYVNANGPQGYHLYRLRDTNGDDRYDAVEVIRKWKGGPGEHGAHGIVLGPDRKLYTVNGNFVDVPEDIIASSPHKNYRDDLVLPRMEDGNGFGAGRKPPGGFVDRFDPDGKKVELFASGQRNTYDIAFNPAGELFGIDSDMEWDWGAPWYRPTRVYHIVSGGDQGFREGSAKWPEYYPDSLPAAVNIGIGSPTGVRFGTGAKFPARYQQACFVMDWSYGRILAVHLSANGSSYGGTFENFVVGKPLNVTDLDIGPDGAMYFAIGGRRTHGGLYRVSYVGKESTKLAKYSDNTKELVAARDLRHRLESFHGRQDPKALSEAWPHLDSADRFIRYAARLAVESQPVRDWQERALIEPRKRASLTALLALARLGPREVQDQLLESLGRDWPAGLDEQQKLEALRVCEVSLARMGTPSADAARDLTESLRKVFPNRSWPLNRELSQLLIALEAPGIAKDVLTLRDSAATQEEQLHYMVALRNLKTGWTKEERLRYFAWFMNRPKGQGTGHAYSGVMAAVNRSTRHPEETLQWFKDVGRDYSDGSSYNNFLKNLRRLSLEAVPAGERSEIDALLQDTPAVAAAPKKERLVVRDWKPADLLPELDQAGKGRSFERGREAYAAAQCATCHRFGNEGGAIGPDITAIASRFSRRDIFDSILEPSKVVSEQYQNITVVKQDGDDVTGRLVEETDAKLVLVPNQLTGEKVELKKSEVRSRSASKLSPMPEGLINVLSKEEIFDLIAYLESGGRREHAAFAK